MTPGHELLHSLHDDRPFTQEELKRFESTWMKDQEPEEEVLDQATLDWHAKRFQEQQAANRAKEDLPLDDEVLARHARRFEEKRKAQLAKDAAAEIAQELEAESINNFQTGDASLESVDVSTSVSRSDDQFVGAFLEVMSAKASSKTR